MQSVGNAQLTKEAQVFTKYLIGKEADSLSVDLYVKANNKLNIPLTEKESKRLDFIVRNPSLIGTVDGALALRNPESGIRKKIYIMFAILESNPAYADYFLPKEHKGSYFISIIGTGIRAAWNALTGFILLAWI